MGEDELSRFQAGVKVADAATARMLAREPWRTEEKCGARLGDGVCSFRANHDGYHYCNGIQWERGEDGMDESREYVEFGELAGRTFKAVEVGSDVITFACDDDATRFVLLHEDDCCESVGLEDVSGDVADLVGSPILRAELATNNDDKPGEFSDSWTWSFYKIETVKGSVTLRWLGESNGYYSEEVSCVKYTKHRPDQQNEERR